MSGWIGVDLDGTLAQLGVPVTAIGAPIPAMVARVKGWLAEGREVRIMTARVASCGATNADNGLVDDDAFSVEQRALIEAWCLEHIGQVLPVTATKDFQMVELWDDRAVQIRANTGQRVDEDYGSFDGLVLQVVRGGDVLWNVSMTGFGSIDGSCSLEDALDRYMRPALYCLREKEKERVSKV